MVLLMDVASATMILLTSCLFVNSVTQVYFFLEMKHYQTMSLSPTHLVCLTAQQSILAM